MSTSHTGMNSFGNQGRLQFSCSEIMLAAMVNEIEKKIKLGIKEYFQA